MRPSNSTARVNHEDRGRPAKGLRGGDVDALLARITGDRYEAFLQSVGPDEAVRCSEISRSEATARRLRPRAVVGPAVDAD